MSRLTSPFPVRQDPPRIRVLIVDDEDSVRAALARFLAAKGHDAVTADSGAAALARLSKDRFDVMLCDIRMPVMTGLDVLPHAVRMDGDLAILMLTGVNDAATATESLNSGAMDYLVKPVDFADLERAVERAAHRRSLEIDRRNVERIIREEVAAQTEELEQERRVIRALTLGVAETLINAMEAKDVYLRGHSQRVADLAASVAEALGMEADEVEDVRLAGRLHDVGKIGVREEVLLKPGPLTPAEFAHIQEHVRIGMEILAPLKHMPMALAYVQDHHENVDGTGYPQGIAGSEITIGGRILRACDAFDALTSRRAFRDALDARATVAHLETYVPDKFDGEVFAALRGIVLRRKTLTFIDELHR